MEVTWKEFTALGTTVKICAYLSKHDKYLLDQAQGRIFEFEQRFSRFKDTSELSEFNAGKDGLFEASPLFVELLKACQEYYRKTKGLFDPTIIGSLEAFGYDKSFVGPEAGLVNDQAASSRLEQAKKDFASRAKFDELVIDGLNVHKPTGLRLDFGGLGKGFVADWLEREVLGGVANYWLSLGGDLLVKGHDGDQPGWSVDVEHPLFSQTSFSIKTLGETLGIATSGTEKRKGLIGDQPWHHLIDPRTGEPAKTEAVAVTVIAPDVLRADIYAKTILILGLEQGQEFASQQGGVAFAMYFRDKPPFISSAMIKYL